MYCHPLIIKKSRFLSKGCNATTKCLPTSILVKVLKSLEQILVIFQLMAMHGSRDELNVINSPALVHVGLGNRSQI